MSRILLTRRQSATVDGRLNGGSKVHVGTFDSAEEAREARQEFLRQRTS